MKLLKGNGMEKREEIDQILYSELTLALGCTEPACAALSGARLRDELGAIPRKAKVRVSRDMMKNAMLAEMAIVYGNRYRSSEKDLNRNLTYSEMLFAKGDYKKSLDLTINSLNKIEPGIYDKLQKLYGGKERMSE